MLSIMIKVMAHGAGRGKRVDDRPPPLFPLPTSLPIYVWRQEVQMQFVLLLVVGAAAGFLATRMMKIQTDVPTTIAIGVGGAVVGGLVIRGLAELAGWMAGFVGAVLGALVLLWIWKTYIARR